MEAIAKEIILRKNYLETDKLQTIYFGGGTPSLLDESELNYLMATIRSNFQVDTEAEITLEANPDDLNSEKLVQLKGAGINRLSIGIQSFHEPHLKYLNRIHNGFEAGNCVQLAQEAGINNISIDLIYAIPAPDHSILEDDIKRAFELDVSHISAYCLTIEPQTAFGSWLKKKKIKPIDEEFAAQQFEILLAGLGANGYEQYEISNFARNGKYSNHNSSYWKQRSYLGIGPSAHSYNGTSREYNVSNNAQYLAAIQENRIPSTVEVLSAADQTNEYLLTGLRTKWGCKIVVLDVLSASDFQRALNPELSSLYKKGWLEIKDGTILLTQAGKLFADRVASELFID